MKNEEIIKHILFYSNTIVGYIVIQGLAFCYTFGTSDKLNDLFKSRLSLSSIIFISFLLIGIISIKALNISRKAIISRVEDEDLLLFFKQLFIAKFFCTIFFSLLPALIILLYAIIQIQN